MVEPSNVETKKSSPPPRPKFHVIMNNENNDNNDNNV